VNGCREFDSFCYQIIYEIGIPLTILPGKDDPTTANWPQRPLHKSFLPVSLRSMPDVKKILSVVPNPFAALYRSTYTVQNENDSFEKKDVEQYVIGTDGTNVQDLVQRLLGPSKGKQRQHNEARKNEAAPEVDTKDYIDMIRDDNGNDTRHTPATVSYEPISELDALEYTLRWGHICPSGPDTVPTIPHGPENPDPMVLMESLPSIYFAGNCSQFATKLVDTSSSYSTQPEQQRQQSRLVCIPKFSNTGEAVMVNLRTLQVQLLRFEE
jgi:DNA polymerase II small subunit/DNA polymerase delta subunit B